MAVAAATRGMIEAEQRIFDHYEEEAQDMTSVSFPEAPLTRECRGKKQHTVLVLEEHPCIEELLRWMLALNGYASGALSDVEQWRQADVPVDAVLFDLDGSRSWLKQVERMWYSSQHQRPAEPNIILLTCQPARKVTLELAGWKVVLKPFKLSILLAALELAVPPEA